MFDMCELKVYWILTIDIGELKAKIIELLRSDEEFRFMVAGLIGLDNILVELKRLREDFNRFIEICERRFNEIFNRFEVVGKRFEANDRKFEEIFKRFEFLERKAMEHDRKLDEHSRMLGRIGMELRILSESFYCKALLDDLIDEINARGERILLRKRNIRIDNFNIDLLVVTDNFAYVAEVKVKPKIRDIKNLLSKCNLISRKYGDRKVIPILAGAMINSRVESYAERMNVKIYSY